MRFLRRDQCKCTGNSPTNLDFRTEMHRRWKQEQVNRRWLQENYLVLYGTDEKKLGLVKEAKDNKKGLLFYKKKKEDRTFAQGEQVYDNRLAERRLSCVILVFTFSAKESDFSLEMTEQEITNWESILKIKKERGIEPLDNLDEFK